MKATFTSQSASSLSRRLSQTNRSLHSQMRKLSTGLRVETAADDAAGLALVRRMEARSRSLGQVRRNVQEGLGVLAVAEGAFEQVSGVVQRLRELAVQSANGVLSDGERGFLQQEAAALLSEVDRIGETTRFGDLAILDGSLGAGSGGGAATPAEVRGSTVQTAPLGKVEMLTFDDFGVFEGLNGGERKILLGKGMSQTDVVNAINGDAAIGARVTATVDAGRIVLTSNATGAAAQFRVSSNRAAAADQTGIGTTPLLGTGSDPTSGDGGLLLQVGIHGTADDRMTLAIERMDVAALGLSAIDLGSVSGARSALSAIDASLDRVSKERSNVGNGITRLRTVLDLAASSLSTTESARSRIEDLDVASATARLVSDQIKRDAGAKLIQEANLQPKMLLRLL